MLLTSARKEIADTLEWLASLCGATGLSRENLIQGQLARQRFKQVKPIHADHPLSSAESHQPIKSEATVADEEPSGPRRLLFELPVEGMQVGRASLRPLPLSLNQVCLAMQLEASVDLLATKAKGFASCHAEGVERIGQPNLDRKAARQRRQC